MKIALIVTKILLVRVCASNILKLVASSGGKLKKKIKIELDLDFKEVAENIDRDFCTYSIVGEISFEQQFFYCLSCSNDANIAVL